ncbi:MAG: hypothetical protein AAGF57_13440 [Pseudomonadota bacterium]
MARLILFLGMLFSIGLQAQTMTFNCDYNAYSSEEGLADVEPPFSIQFLMDLDAQKAYIVGNQGSTEVSIIPGTQGVSFVEVTDSGNVMTTSIVLDAKNDKDVGRTVHSRHVVVSGLGELMPSQYYGVCDTLL